MATVQATPARMYYADKYGAMVMPVAPTRLTDTHVTLGGKRHTLRNQAGTGGYFLSWEEAYNFVLKLRLAHAQRHAVALAAFDPANLNEVALADQADMVRITSEHLQEWLTYGEQYRKGQSNG